MVDGKGWWMANASHMFRSKCFRGKKSYLFHTFNPFIGWFRQHVYCFGLMFDEPFKWCETSAMCVAIANIVTIENAFSPQSWCSKQCFSGRFIGIHEDVSHTVDQMVLGNIFTIYTRLKNACNVHAILHRMYTDYTFSYLSYIFRLLSFTLHCRRVLHKTHLIGTRVKCQQNITSSN